MRGILRCIIGSWSRAYVWSKISRRGFFVSGYFDQGGRGSRWNLSAEDIHLLASLWYQPINDASTVDPGVRPMLELLRRAGTKLGIVSNTLATARAHCLDQHLAEHGLLEFFPIRVYSSFVRYRKPHARIFEMALSQIGTTASRTMFVGDHLASEIEGANRAGMRTIWKPGCKVIEQGKGGGKGAPTPRRQVADFVIPKVTHLPEALQHFGWNPPAPRTRHHSKKA